jgi:DNA polymerase-3 subunit epsilon
VKEINIWDANYVVVDVETTGNSSVQNRIIDLAAVNLHNGEFSAEFSSLINPHQFIPPFISQMTGITNEAVFYAPEASAVVPKFLENFKPENSIFVAHNANFDYGFVKETLKRCGYLDFDFPVLDSLKLARRVLADAQKKSVGNLAAYFGIKIRNRHTALGDAKATAKVLLYLLEMIEEEHEITSLEELMLFQNKKLSYFTPPPKNFAHLESKIEQLPEAPGVYYFYNSRKKVIYVGKAKSLKNRTGSYFKPGNITSHKLKELTSHIADLNWTETNNELSALLLEAKEIKRLHPQYNFAGRRLRKLSFLKLTTDELFPRVAVVNGINDDCEYFGPFTNRKFAEDIKDIIDKNFRLTKCEKTFTLASDKDPCLYEQMNLCLAPCAKKEPNSFIAKYTFEVEQVRSFLSGFAEGLIQSLENKMYKLSDSLEFEKANELKQSIISIKKIFNNSEKFINSINDQNFILILPVQGEDKLVDIFYFRFARLMFHKTIGRKAFQDMDLMVNYTELFLSNEKPPQSLSLEEVEEIKISNSWLAQNKENGKVIYTSNIPDITQFPSILQNNILETAFV